MLSYEIRVIEVLVNVVDYSRRCPVGVFELSGTA